MYRSVFTVFAITLLSAMLAAQTAASATSGTLPQAPQGSTAEPAAPAAPNATSTATSAALKIAPGSVLPVELTKGINAKKAKKGDEVVVKVTQDLRNTQGALIIPKDTEIVGHVTQAQAHSKEQKESELAIAFDHAVLKNGETMQMPMSIQAIIAPPNRNPANSASGYPSSSPAPGASPTPTAAGGRPGMGGTAPSTTTAPQSESSSPAETPAPTQTRPQITGETQGVVGIADLKLSAAPDATQGSLVTSEKNNVKLEDGTFLLLRVQP
jgi:hypothetical protein